MAWQDEMIPIVRALIGDSDSPTTYSDTRIEETLVVAAQLIYATIDFDNDYTITISTTTISPDPTTSPKDDGFINLTCLRAACFILDSEARSASRYGIRVHDGPSIIDTNGRLSSSILLSKQMKANFDFAKVEYQAGNSRAGEAILSPYTNLNVMSQSNF